MLNLISLRAVAFDLSVSEQGLRFNQFLQCKHDIMSAINLATNDGFSYSKGDYYEDCAGEVGTFNECEEEYNRVAVTTMNAAAFSRWTTTTCTLSMSVAADTKGSAVELRLH